MRMTISYEEARKEYPEAVAEILTDAANSKKLSGNTLPGEVLWQLEWCVQAIGGNFTDLLEGKGAFAKKAVFASREEEFEDLMNRVSFPVLLGSFGKWVHYVKVPGTPEPIRRFYQEAMLSTPSPDEDSDLPRLRILNGGSKEQYAVVSGYRRPKSESVQLIVERGGLKIVYQVKGDSAMWGGGMKDKFVDKLSKTLPGGKMIYNNKTFYRLSDEDIEALCKKEYALALSIF